MTARCEAPASGKSMLPPMYLLLALVAMAGLHLAFPLHRIVVFPWRVMVLVSLALGLTLNLAADRLLKQHHTTVKPFEKPAAIVTGGVYQISRNPMYLGFVLILLGAAVLMGSLSPFLVVSLFAVLIDVIFIRNEERTMNAVFGKDWRVYKAKVRRWI